MPMHAPSKPWEAAAGLSGAPFCQTSWGLLLGRDAVEMALCAPTVTVSACSCSQPWSFLSRNRHSPPEVSPEPDGHQRSYISL